MQRMIKARDLAWALTFVMILSMLAVPSLSMKAQAASKKVKVTKVTAVSSLTGSKTIYLAQGKKVSLKTTVTVTPDKPANKKVTYKSSNEKIATVNGKGVVKGKKAGTVKITVTSKKNSKKKATVKVQVLKGKVTGIQLDKTSGTLTVGDTVTLKETVKTSKGGKKNVVWTSSDEKVATVKKGAVTAVGAGEAVITVTAADGSGKKAEYKVTVKGKEANKPEVTTTEDKTTETPTLEKPTTTEKPAIEEPTPEKPTPVEKNAADVEVLQKIIEAQNALGANLPTDLDSDAYTWDETNGRLTMINWSECGLQGTLSFEGLTALNFLYCSDNQLTGLDVSDCKSLIRLSCSDNQLTSLDVSGYKALIRLYCSDNQLTKLNVSGCTALTMLNCQSNQLTELNLSGCIALTNLNYSGNQLTIEKNASDEAILNEIIRTQNALGANLPTDLDDSNHYIWIDGQVTYINWNCLGVQGTLSFEGLTALRGLYCIESELTELDVSKNTALISLKCSANRLTELDVSKNTALISLDCCYNQLIKLDVSKNTALTTLCCGSNYEADNPEGYSCNRLAELDVSKNTALTTLYCGSNQLTKLDVSKNTALTTLDCSQNEMTELDVSGCTTLTTLYCRSNQLTKLDVSGCMTLTTLYCGSNQLTKLDMSKNTALIELDCENNQLTSLDVMNCTRLKYLTYDMDKVTVTGYPR